MRDIHYDWERYWVEIGETESTEYDDGFLDDPEADFAFVQQKAPKTYNEISDYSCLFLLGEGGIGKSATISEVVDDLKSDDENVISQDLSDISSFGEIENFVFNNENFDRWVRRGDETYIFLDSLDECIINYDTVVGNIAKKIKKVSSHLPRLKLRIACRTGYWQHDKQTRDTFTELFGEKDVGTFELAPLRRRDAKKAAAQLGFDSESFLREIYRKRIESLARVPVTFRLLTELYGYSESLPETRKEIYRKGCRALCGEEEASRQRRHVLSESHRLALAERIAALSVFGGRKGIFVEASGTGASDTDLTIPEITGGIENTDGQQIEVDADGVRETVNHTGLFTGAVRARTVTAALRVVGRDQARDFGAYHRVLSRAVWSPREAARRLLVQLISRLVPEGPLVFGIDDTIERRWGPKIKARGIYRDPVRSSRGHFVKASGLRWLSMMLLTPIPWAGRVWALPVLTVLCPSERYSNTYRKRHKKLTDWARQMILQLRRWLPARKLVVVGDSSFSVIDLLARFHAVKCHAVTMVTRLRLDAALYEPAPPRQPGTLGRPRKKGQRLPKLEERLEDSHTEWQRVKATWWYGHADKEVEVATGTGVWYHSGKPVVPLRWVLARDPEGDLDPKAFLSTDLDARPTDILRWFVRRWSVEVTFEEMRRHLGMETQEAPMVQQWSDLAILRTTPCLLGLFSLVTLMADRLARTGALDVGRDAWYEKPHPTFSDALAAVRILLWKRQRKHYSGSGPPTGMLKIPAALFERLLRALSYTA